MTVLSKSALIPSKFSLCFGTSQLNKLSIIDHVGDFSSDVSVACVWSVCVARKAPLVASDSSSSNSSDSDEEEGKKESALSQTVTVETVTTGAGKETLRLTVDAKNERAFFSRYTHTHTLGVRAPSPSVCSVSPLVCIPKDSFSLSPPNCSSHNSTSSSSSSVFPLLFPSSCLFPPFPFTHAEFSNQQSDGMFCPRSPALVWNVL